MMSLNRPISDFPRNEAGLVDNFIGTAYDTVKAVYDALPEIRELHDIVEEIPQLGEVAVEAAMVPARVEIAAGVAAAEGFADASEASAVAAAQSALDAQKANIFYPFAYNLGQTVYDVKEISGDNSVTTMNMALWVEGSIDFNFTVMNGSEFVINNPELYADGAQMGVLVNNRFSPLVQNVEDMTEGFSALFEISQDQREAEFNTWLLDSGLEVPVAYVAGLHLTRASQVVTYLGDDYRVSPENLPLVTTNWATDSPNLRMVGNDSLRAELLEDDDASLGSALSGHLRTPLANQITNVQQALSGQRVNIFEFAKYIVDRSGAPSTWDWTLATASAQAYLFARNKGVIQYPAGQYPHKYILRVPGVSLEGEGSYSTYFTALPYVKAGTYGMVEIVAGAVSGSHMKGIHIMGSASVGHNNPPVNPLQWGCYFKAQWDVSYQHGGLWFSIHDDVRVSNFNKGLWSRGGYTIANYQRPIQFLQYRNFFVQVPNGGEAIRMTGQHGQIEFSGGSAEGSDGMVALTAITIDWDPDPSTMADNASGHGESTGDLPGVGNAVQSPYNVNFGNSFSIQKSRKGLYARNCRQVGLRGLWVEDIAEFIDITSNAHVTVEASHLANAASGVVGGVAGSGYLCRLGSGAYLELKSTSDTIGTVDRYIEETTNLNNIAGLKLEGLAFGNTYQKFKAAGYKTFTLTGGNIDIGAHKFVVMNPSTGDYSLKLATLLATAAPGERITIRPLNGAITLSNAGNISLWGETELCCPQSGVITLERLFQVTTAEWALVSISEHRATAAPTDGFYYPQNHRIWRRGAVANQFMGWICTTAGLAGSTAVFKAMPNLVA
jgi:hypothetical protein